MRFKEFLAEREHSDFAETIQKIKMNCHPFLADAGGEFLYRGMSKWHANVAKQIDTTKARYSAHPEDRAPKDSGEAHDFNFVFNAGVELAFNIQDVRRQTVFATGDANQASMYGETTYFFPAGEFKFLSSAQIGDSYESYHKLREDIRDRMSAAGYEIGLGSVVRNKFTELAKVLTPHAWVENNRGGRSVAELTHAAFKCEKDGDFEFYEALRKAVAETFSKFYKDSPTLKPAIKKKHEILFYETHGYYSIPMKMIMAEMERRGIEHHGINDGKNEAVDTFLQDYLGGNIPD